MSDGFTVDPSRDFGADSQRALTKAEHDALVAIRRRPVTQDPMKRGAAPIGHPHGAGVFSPGGVSVQNRAQSEQNP